MIRVREIAVPVENDNNDVLKQKISKKLKIDNQSIKTFKIHKKSIDARKKDKIVYKYEVDIDVLEEQKILQTKFDIDILKTPCEKYNFEVTGTNELINNPVIVGSGPAGLFCAYMLAESGYNPIILERGFDIDLRVEKVNEFWNNGKLDLNTNVQFGCGGAGTFSDGKLNTLNKDPMFRQRRVLELFVENGAPEEILYESKPHIGTDKLRLVIKNICHKITSLGGKFYFETKLTNIFYENEKIKQIEINNQKYLNVNVLVLAIGHSARDTFKMLYQNKLLMIAKPFAVGLRIMHQQQMINNSQYGLKYAKILSPASYKLTFNSSYNRGVYTFCNCPGGYVVNASSEKGMLAINGMSNYLRESEISNCAVIVSVGPKDFGNGPLAGMEFQRNLEKKAFIIGKGCIPLQCYGDFKNNRMTTKFGKIKPVLKGKYNFGNLQEIFPEYINKSLIEGIEYFGTKIKGYNEDDAIMAGVESRTSSPVKILRDENFQSNIKGLYPCGEGAGYAGGITSAAVDGLVIAEAIVKKYKGKTKK